MEMCKLKILRKIFLCLALLIFFVFCNICTNEIIKSENIDTENKIVLFSRDAGATTSPSLQISIIDINKQLENSKGNICITNGRNLDYRINNECINIFYTSELFLKKDEFKNYLIEYVKEE